MAIPEILIVLSSITVQDTLPTTPKTIPAVRKNATTDSLPGKKQIVEFPDKVKKEKEALLKKIGRGGWDRN